MYAYALSLHLLSLLCSVNSVPMSKSISSEGVLDCISFPNKCKKVPYFSSLVSINFSRNQFPFPYKKRWPKVLLFHIYISEKRTQDFHVKPLSL